MNFAPIILFVYNRPLHTQMTLEALSENDLANDSILYIYADGPKENATTEQKKKIQETRDVIRSRNWCKQVIIVESELNNGLAKSIVKGVTDVVNKHGKIIVLEDDLVTTKGFLKYMNDALTVYNDEEKVMHISGYIYPAKIEDQEEQTFFVNILSCWGWATWARAWKFYDADSYNHVAHFNSNKEIKKFNIEGHADYYHQLILNKEGRINTWAVKWYASWLSHGGYSLFPYKSLAQNNGFDNSGTNSKSDSQFNSMLTDYVVVEKKTLTENLIYRKAIDSFYATAVPYLKIKIIMFLKKYGIYSKLQKILK
jgi:hypothetical protein